jgi:hypothetical protein
MHYVWLHAVSRVSIQDCWSQSHSHHKPPPGCQTRHQQSPQPCTCRFPWLGLACTGQQLQQWSRQHPWWSAAGSWGRCLVDWWQMEPPWACTGEQLGDAGTGPSVQQGATAVQPGGLQAGVLAVANHQARPCHHLQHGRIGRPHANVVMSGQLTCQAAARGPDCWCSSSMAAWVPPTTTWVLLQQTGYRPVCPSCGPGTEAPHADH